jgi:hypothetical protein
MAARHERPQRALMTKKRKRADAPVGKPKGLRKQLRKAEADLAKAVAKRDKAQARVEAMGIIADELRSQLADREKAKGSAASEAQPARRRPRTGSTASSGKTERGASTTAKRASGIASPGRRTPAAEVSAD